jgi:CRISPR/Cas system CSM-associated protein Csm5 (group 7 of RAMP superfamily)
MSTVVVVVIGFGAGLLTMTIMNFYKWFLKVWNRDLE